MGLSKSNSRCVIQLPVLTSGGPLAHARIGQLHAVAGHTEMNLLLVTMRRPAAAANRLVLLEFQRLSFRQPFDVRQGEPKDADCAGDIL